MLYMPQVCAIEDIEHDSIVITFRSSPNKVIIVCYLGGGKTISSLSQERGIIVFSIQSTIKLTELQLPNIGMNIFHLFKLVIHS